MKKHLDILINLKVPLIKMTKIGKLLIGSTAANMDCDVF